MLCFCKLTSLFAKSKALPKFKIYKLYTQSEATLSIQTKLYQYFQWVIALFDVDKCAKIAPKQWFSDVYRGQFWVTRNSLLICT